MNWLFPGFLAGAALVGLPVLLHFLRSRPKTVVPFPSLRFLGETAIRDTRKHRLRRWLTLLLRCLVIGLLAAAFARPFFVDAAAARRRVVVVAVDNSMSMQARGRWEEMRAWALQQLDELQPGDQAAVLTMHPAPTWIAPMTDDLARVRATLQDAQPGFEKTRYAQALQIAGETLAANPAGTKTLVWMADEQRIGWLGVDLNRTLPPGVQVRLAPTAPAPGRQAAIVALRRLDGDGAAGLEATVRLYQPAQEQRRVAVRANGRVLLEQTAALRAGDNRVELRFAAPPDAPGVRVSLLDPDDLPADDAAWIATAKTAGNKVLLDKTDGADFLAHALRSTQRLEAADGALEPAPLPDGPWPAGTAVIVRGASAFRPPQLERLDRFVDAGGPVWIFVDGTPEQIDWLKKRGVQAAERAAASGENNALHLRDWDPEHPILAAFAGQSLLPLLNVEFYRGFDLSGGALLPLANWPDGKTALAEWSGEGRRILLAGFPLDRASTNWPAQPSFVPFVHQAARWLGMTGAARSDWRVGDSIPLPPGQGTWRAIDSATPQPGRAVSGAVRPTAPGLYEFAAGSARKVVAVNIPPEESDLSPWPQPEKLAALESKDAEAPAKGQSSLPVLPVGGEAAENQQRIWWWALAFCGACVLVELALANRTAM